MSALGGRDHRGGDHHHAQRVHEQKIHVEQSARPQQRARAEQEDSRDAERPDERHEDDQRLQPVAFEIAPSVRRDHQLYRVIRREGRPDEDVQRPEQRRVPRRKIPENRTQQDGDHHERQQQQRQLGKLFDAFELRLALFGREGLKWHILVHGGRLRRA